MGQAGANVDHDCDKVVFNLCICHTVRLWWWPQAVGKGDSLPQLVPLLQHGREGKPVEVADQKRGEMADFHPLVALFIRVAAGAVQLVVRVEKLLGTAEQWSLREAHLSEEPLGCI